MASSFVSSHVVSLVAAIDWFARMEAWLEKQGPGIVAGAVSFILVLLVGWVVIALIVGALARVLRRRKVSSLLERFLLMLTRRVL